METSQVVQQIQSVLAPAIMISSSALLLLGFQNKFSNLASRFRALNHEERLLLQKNPRNAEEDSRLKNVSEQVKNLMTRARYVQHAIIGMYYAIICFTGTSIVIFLNLFTPLELWNWGVIIFLAGFLCVLSSAVFLILETKLFYRILVLEHRS